MSIRNLICEHIVLPVSDILTGQKVYSYLKFLRTSAQWTADEIRLFQEKRFRLLISHIASSVPFYRRYFAENHLSISDFNCLEDIAKLPIVDKALIRKYGLDQFLSDAVPTSDRVITRSSGSTGEPFVYHVSKDAYSFNLAAKLRTWYESGYRLGDRYMKISNSPRHGKTKKFQDWVNNCIFLHFSSVDDCFVAQVLETIEKEKPKYIRAYPAPLYLLAKYRLSHKGYSFCPNKIFTTGATLTKEYRSAIMESFGCDVIDSYSCEGVPNTAETPAHDGYHVSSEYALMEVLDDEGQNVREGLGRVVSTDLWNFAQPFVRYDAHDLVSIKDGMIAAIMGRECEAYVVSNGTTFTVHNFSSYFIHENACVDAYQIVRKKTGIVVIRVVPNEEFTNQSTQKIIDDWSQRLGVSVVVEVVGDIPIMNNNKRLTIVDE